MELSEYAKTSSNAEIYVAKFKGEEILLKVVSKEDEYIINELQREIRVYQDLRGLQGEIIPELKVYGWLPDGRYAMGLSNCGSYPEWTIENRKKALQTLQSFHYGGYVHGDLKPDVFVLREDGKLFILDFGRSFRAEKDGDYDEMHAEDGRMFRYFSKMTDID